jgi:hypothetical protein
MTPAMTGENTSNIFKTGFFHERGERISLEKCYVLYKPEIITARISFSHFLEYQYKGQPPSQ